MSNELVTIFPRRALKCIEKGDVKKADEILDQILSNLKELSQEAPSLYWPELARIMYAEMDCVHRVRQRRHRNRGGKGFRAAGTTDIISHGVVLPFGFAAPGA